jgi:hypothetical protein
MVIKLEEDKIIVGNWRSREELIRDMKKYGITVKCFPVSRRLKKGGGVGPALDIRFVTAESGRASFIHGAKSKELAIELLGLRTKEDCERVNRELES